MTLFKLSDGYRIEKQDYSLNPWRILTPNGEQLTITGTTDGGVPATVPASAPTKTEAIKLLGQLLAQALKRPESRISITHPDETTANVMVDGAHCVAVLKVSTFNDPTGLSDPFTAVTSAHYGYSGPRSTCFGETHRTPVTELVAGKTPEAAAEILGMVAIKAMDLKEPQQSPTKATPTR